MSAFIEDTVEAQGATGQKTNCDRYNATRRARGLSTLSPEQYGIRCDLMAVYKDGELESERVWAREELRRQDHPVTDRWGDLPPEIPMPDHVREAFERLAGRHNTTAQAVIRATGEHHGRA